MIFVLNNVLVTLVVSALLTLYVEFRVRARTRRICGCDPIFLKLRSGRVRFTLNDLFDISKRPFPVAQPTPDCQERRAPAPHPDSEGTIDDQAGDLAPRLQQSGTGFADG
ncbi:MAG: hypothetical protein ACT4NY_05605 [Pseudonocardiales bacterium]